MTNLTTGISTPDSSNGYKL